MTQEDKQLLLDNLESLRSATHWLKHSFEQCQSLDPEQADNPTTQDAFEALTARYGRVVDILTNKVFRSIIRYEMEEPGTMIDTVNKMHKRHIIQNADTFKQYKDLRNTITHEYETTKLVEVHKLVLAYTPHLLNIIESTSAYITAQ